MEVDSKNNFLVFDSEKILEQICKAPLSFEKVKEGYLMKRMVGVGFRGQKTQFIFPDKIKIKPSTAGLIVGEGYFKRNFIFCNSNETVIKEIMDFLFQFNFKLHFVLEIAMKNMPKKFINESKIKWEELIKNKIKRIRLRNEFNNTSIQGSLHIALYNSLFPKVLEKILKIIKIKAENEEDIAQDYLRGIIAAEGNINVKSTTTNCLYMIRISAKRKEEREHYKKCLKRIGLNIYCQDMETISPEEGIKLGWKTNKGRAGAVIISRWDNFIKIFENDLLIMHQEKVKKFNEHFFYNKFTKQFLDFEPFINREFSMKEVQNHFNFSGRYLNRVFTFLAKEYISRRKINQRNYIYKMTDKYKSLYNKLNLIPSSPTSQSPL